MIVIYFISLHYIAWWTAEYLDLWCVHCPCCMHCS